jgi:hypothetical protein
MTASVSHSACSSARYVLPADAPHLRNLPALWAHDPELAAAIEALEADPSYIVEPAKSGELTLSVPTGDGRRVHLHSRYKPGDDAAKLIHSIDCEQNSFFQLFGIGLGYHLELLFDRAGDEAAFCVFEPDLQLLRTAFASRDLSRLIDSRRVLFFTQLDKGNLFVRLQPHTPLFTIGSVDVDHAPSVQRDPEFHRQMKAWIAEFSSFSRTNMNTLVMNGRRTLENIARNLSRYTATPCVSTLKDRYKKKPALIVAAGPSLRKNKHRIKEMVGSAVIISLQTTLQPLLDMGVEPDFVTALDYSDICSRFFEKLPKNLRTQLIAEPKATPAIFSLNPGPTTVIGNDLAESLLRELKLNKTKLQAGSTVAHLAYYLAEHLGCDPIVFVGQDLGFSDGLYYSPGTSYEDVWRPEFGRFCTVEMKQWEQIVRDRPILRKIPDQQGRPMYTEDRMFTYLQQFERDFSLTSTKIIDASEGGARKLGTSVMSLSEVIDQYCRQPLPELESQEPQPEWNRLGECAGALENRKQEAREIESISRQTLPLLEEIRDRIEDQEAVTRLIGRIDLLRNQMNSLGRTYDLLMQMTQGTELRRFCADRKISAAKLTGVERQRQQLSRDIDNVRAVMQAADDFQNLMDDVIEEMQKGECRMQDAEAKRKAGMAA